VIITASDKNDCQFCANAHVDIVDIWGIVDAPLAAIAAPETLPPRERLAVEYTRAVMSHSNAIPESLWEHLHEHFSDPELVELTFLVGYINMLNLFNNALQVRYRGDYRVLREATASR
jgi:AhpD family alkylhydroperoxidase